MKLSVVIPAHNEEGCIERTVRILHAHLSAERIEHEILIVDDNSSDRTEEILLHLRQEIPAVSFIKNAPPNGFGFAVRKGLENYTGDAVAIYMADGSDRPQDLVQFVETLEEKQVDCVFGSRFVRGAKVVDYPYPKLVLNRFANLFIQMVFGLRYNDVTNAFKLYRRHVIDGLKPFLSHHFNLTVELPLKAIVRGYSYAVVPNDWINRKAGLSKLKVQEMGSRYLFIVLYCLIEKLFSRGDYLKRLAAADPDGDGVLMGAEPQALVLKKLVPGVLLILYFALAALPIFGAPIGTGVDGSWLYGVNYLAQSEYLFGRDVAFTYGPLAYLQVPLNIGNNLGRAVWFGLFMHALTVAVLLYQLLVKRRLLSVAAFVPVYLFAHHTLSRIWGREYEFLTVVCMLLYVSLERNRYSPVADFVCGLLASAFLFMKFSLGISALAMLLLCKASQVVLRSEGWRRALLIAGGTYLLTTVVLALALFRSPAYFGRWLKMSFDIADGYSVSNSLPGRADILYAGAAVLALYIVLALALYFYRRGSKFRLLPLVYASGIFISFKHGFVRQDVVHPLYFFNFALVVIGVLALSAVNAKEITASMAAALLVLILAYPAVTQFAPHTYASSGDTYLLRDGLANADALGHMRKYRSFLNGMSRANLAVKRLPNGWAETIRRSGGKMDALPWEISYSPANDLVWRPSPVLQTYIGAHTAYLDRRNAEHYGGHGAPDFLVVEFTNLDNRNLLLDVPDTWRAILQNYEVRQRDPRGMVLLGKKAQPRQPRMTDVGRGQGAVDEWVDVPASDNMLFASIDLRPRLFGKFAKAAFRIPPVHIDVSHGSGRSASYRITPDVAKNGLLINYVPAGTDDLDKLFTGAPGDRVLKFRLSGPGASYYHRVFDLTWRQDSNYKVGLTQAHMLSGTFEGEGLPAATATSRRRQPKFISPHN